MDREEAAKELMAMLEEAQEGPYYVFDKTLSFIIIKGVSPFVGLPRKQVLLR